MFDRYSRFVPLTGVVWGVLAVVAVVTGPGETPEANSAPLKVVHYYFVHSSEIELAGILFTIAFLAFLLFAGSLRAYLRRVPSAEPLATLMLAGVVLMTAAAGIGGGIEVGLAQNIVHITPQVAQGVNLVSQEAFLPVIVGGFVFSLCSGLAILRSELLPRWLGWVALAIAVLFLIPPAFFAGLIAGVVWSVITAVILFQRYDQARPAAAPAPA